MSHDSKSLYNKVKVERVKQPISRPYSWWDAQAYALSGGSCPKCNGLTFGQYVPPTKATVNECAVIEHCRLCGWEQVVIQGRSGVPAGMNPTYSSDQ